MGASINNPRQRRHLVLVQQGSPLAIGIGRPIRPPSTWLDSILDSSLYADFLHSTPGILTSQPWQGKKPITFLQRPPPDLPLPWQAAFEASQPTQLINLFLSTFQGGSDPLITFSGYRFWTRERSWRKFEPLLKCFFLL